MIRHPTRAMAVMVALFWAPLAPVAAPGAAPGDTEETVIAGLSQSHVSITTDFSGSEIFVYGAIKREAPVPKGWPLDVIIAATGPQ